jgi:uncharacterized membrane protein
MIKENKLKYLISSIIIVLPSLVGLMLKDSVKSYAKGGWYFTWIMPIVLLALHTGMLVLTRYIDPVKQSNKIENMIFFTVPAISVYTGAIFIALMLGVDINLGAVLAVIMGISFIVMGNYMPKAKRNCTYGLKIRWTMANDDNWVATHRVAGKLFVIAGIVSFAMAFFPVSVTITALIIMLAVIAIVPAVYSYKFYKRQIESGEATKEDYEYDTKKWQKNAAIVTVISVAAVIIVCIMLTSGGLKFTFGDNALTVKPSFGGGVELEYSELADATVEYREERVPGTRVMGYGSMKLLYGTFHNDEFGNYTRYTYTDSEASIVIYIGDDVIVLADETAELTRALYDELIVKIDAAKK